MNRWELGVLKITASSGDSFLHGHLSGDLFCFQSEGSLRSASRSFVCRYSDKRAGWPRGVCSRPEFECYSVTCLLLTSGKIALLSDVFLARSRPTSCCLEFHVRVLAARGGQNTAREKQAVIYSGCVCTRRMACLSTLVLSGV